MKLLYLVYFDLNNTQFHGVRKKILNQVKALREIGIDTDIAYCREEYLLIESVNEKIELPLVKGYTNYRYSIYKILRNHIQKWDYDTIYIRYPGSVDLIFFNTIKLLSQKGIKVYLEMPTYPIGNELINELNNLRVSKKYLLYVLKSIIYFIHFILSRKIKYFVFKIVTFMPYPKIWGCESIIIDNGININDFTPLIKNKKSDNNINLISVANVAIWHGLDRVLEGMGVYYQTNKICNKKIFFTVVGSGSLIKELEERAKELKIERYVDFVGAKTGKELIKEYSKSDIAISSLGMHRIGVLNGSTLKTKEYCAQGIPFVLAYNEKEINDDFKYCLKISSDDSPLDMGEIIKFYEYLLTQNDISENMYNFACQKYDWRFQMKKIFYDECLEE